MMENEIQDMQLREENRQLKEKLAQKSFMTVSQDYLDNVRDHMSDDIKRAEKQRDELKKENECLKMMLSRSKELWKKISKNLVVNKEIEELDMILHE